LKVISHSVNHQDGGEPALGGRINSWSLGGPTIQPGVRDPGFTLARFRSEFRFTLVDEGNKRMLCSLCFGSKEPIARCGSTWPSVICLLIDRWRIFGELSENFPQTFLLRAT